MASERQDRLRALVLAACEDLGRYGLEPTPEAVAAVASLVVNASRLGAEVDAAAEIACLARELEESRRERSAARAEALTAQASLRRVERELEEARERERALREALMTISMRCYEAVMQTPLLEHQSMHALAGACKQDADAALAGQSALAVDSEAAS